MTTTNGNRKILDLKRWEFCTPAPVATAAAAFVVSSRHYRQQQMLVTSATVAYLYHPAEDGWTQLPSPALAGTFAAGACGTSVSVGPSGTATAGTTSTLTTNLTLARDLRGYSIHITGGPNAGAVLPIVSNTIGTNAVITVATQGTAFTSASTYRLMTPRCYVLNAITASGTTTAAVFKCYHPHHHHHPSAPPPVPTRSPCSQCYGRLEPCWTAVTTFCSPNWSVRQTICSARLPMIFSRFAR
jgi:hypothetical protein